MLFAMAVVPPVAALLWTAVQGGRVEPVLVSAVMYGVVTAVLVWLGK